MPITNGSPLLSMEGISKTFPGVKALDDVSFDLEAGEVHAIVGENGAGKSTLIKILSGVHHPDEGQIWLEGRAVRPQKPGEMLDLGVSVIYQELNLTPYLSVAENVFLGREPLRAGGLIDWKRMRQQVDELLRPFSVSIDPRDTVASLGAATQQVVEIAKALSLNAKIIVMDEPTATLTGTETERLFDIIGTLRERGVGVIYISHRLEEVDILADRVTVLRDGQRIITDRKANLTRDEIIRHMVGRETGVRYSRTESRAVGEELLRVEGLTEEGVCSDISFTLRRGEILGVSGLVGAGRTEMAQLLFGYRRRTSGRIFVHGKEMKSGGPWHAVHSGMALVPEERKRHGLVQILTVADNLTLPVLDGNTTLGFLRNSMLRNMVDRIIERIRIRTPSPRQTVRNLSGGNQQKVVLGKWFLRQSDIVIFDEPTRGIDVGAKAEIYRLMEELLEGGAGIIMISSELPEILNISDRVLVMHRGRVVKELQTAATDQAEILSYAIGGESGALERARELLGENV